MKRKTLYALAFKNLKRYGKRTLITAGAIAVGMASYILIDSLLLGSIKESERNIIDNEYGQGVMMTPKGWEEREYFDLANSLEDRASILKDLNQQGVVATPRIKFSSEVLIYKDPFPEDGSLSVTVTAIDPEEDPKVYELKDSLTQGQWFKGEQEKALLGQWLANDLKAEVGFPLTLVTKTKEGYYQTMDLEVGGIITSTDPYVNRSGFYIPLDLADYALDMEGSSTEINIKPGVLDDNELEDFAQERGLLFLSWKDLASDFVSASNADKYSSLLILLLIFIIAAVGISNTMLMSVMERTKELGMMRSLGTEVKEIKRLFSLEAGGIGLLGSTLGALLGALFNIPLANKGIDIGSSFDQMDVGYRISSIMYGVWHPQAYIIAIVSGVCIAMVVSRLSVRKILKKTIVQELRHV